MMGFGFFVYAPVRAYTLLPLEWTQFLAFLAAPIE